MRLLIITQKVDKNDDLLGSFHTWLDRLGKATNHVDVITLYKGTYDLPSNVHVYSLGKERHYPKWLQGLRFYYYLLRLTPRATKLFAHMSPIFLVAAAPVAWLFNKKMVLWYVHRSVTLRLKIATWCANKILTTSTESFRLKSPKVLIVGHGIDGEYFKPVEQQGARPFTILAVGRLSPIKHFDTLLKAGEIMRDKGLQFQMRIIGRAVMPIDHAYERELQHFISEKKLDMVHLVGFVPYSQIADHYRNADIAVNLTPTGGHDRTVLEAMAVGIPVVASNTALKDDFGSYSSQLLFEFENPKDLASKLEVLMTVDRREMGLYLRSRVLSHHSLDQVVKKIIEA